MNTLSHVSEPTFEQAYPKAPFAELIRLTVALAEQVAKYRARSSESASATDEMNQAATG